MDIAALVDRIFSASRRRNYRPGEAIRLFNGFFEGYKPLSIDRYGDTIVFQSFAKSGLDARLREPLIEAFRSDPTVGAILLKERFAAAVRDRNGVFLFGGRACGRIREFEVSYTIDLRLNRDCSFYLDAANLRKWILNSSRGKTVLNAFAYTGSLGLAALAGGAAGVVQNDLNPAFLKLYEDEAARGGIERSRYESAAVDFFSLATAYRKSGRLFDMVILDPPMFSVTGKGRVDQQRHFIPLINKARPLVADGGTLILVNNALYLSGAAFLAGLRSALPREYVAIGEPIPVPASFIGAALDIGALPADPAPFNHPTKIIPLTLRRKDGRSASMP